MLHPSPFSFFNPRRISIDCDLNPSAIRTRVHGWKARVLTTQPRQPQGFPMKIP